MFLVGELINESRKAVSEAIHNRDKDYIVSLAKAQHEAGAKYIDVNAALSMEKEIKKLVWLIKLVQYEVKAPCCIDSPNPKAIEYALETHDSSYGPAMINSISLEQNRFDSFLSLVKGTNLKVVALCMSDAGFPNNVQQRLDSADKLINGLVRAGINITNIYVDPLVQPVATDIHTSMVFLRSIELIISEFPGVHTICGLSNVSYGLPLRNFVNQTFVTMAIAKGLDSAFVNPLDKRLMANVICAESLAGRDDFCQNYLAAYRAGILI